MKLNYKKIGEGKPLLILHGLFGSSDNWGTLGKKFAENNLVYLIDLRNHGRSPHSKEMSYDLMADDLLELIEHENINSPIILGHSMGGKAALLFAEKYPLVIFKSKEIKFANGQFEILGELMIKGITQVIKLLAEPIAFDPKVLEPESEFDFKISATINRNDFNAGAFSGIVSDRIFLNSRLKLERIR